MRLVGVIACACIAASAAGACTHAPLPPPASAQARIGVANARFVFPSEFQEALPTAPDARGWGAWLNWWGPSIGTAPNAIWVAPPDSSAAGSVGLLVQVMTHLLNSEPPQISGVVDSAVTAQFSGGRLVVSVRGAEAIKRTFPQAPDSLRLSWSSGLGSNRSLMVAVERREP
jgi:hypothetical protein